jgi:GNAT superfamily N-acetyltransferase
MLNIRLATSLEGVAIVRRLLREYQNAIGANIGFRGFESELARIHGKYAPPAGRLYPAFDDGQAVGCTGRRKLAEDICEWKRLYVRPDYRGRGIARKLVVRAINDARKIGYRSMRLDTLRSMLPARKLYRSLGFKAVRPYTHDPVPGALFFELALRQALDPLCPAKHCRLLSTQAKMTP